MFRHCKMTLNYRDSAPLIEENTLPVKYFIVQEKTQVQLPGTNKLGRVKISLVLWWASEISLQSLGDNFQSKTVSKLKTAK